MPRYKLIVLSRTGLEFEKEIVDLLELINDKPLLFPIRFAHIRETVVKRFPFVINFGVMKNLIIVSAIFHTKQSPVKKTKHKPK